ncbi:MAG: aminotransferase class V-fold PLP-dependent enzyme [archaeon]
MILPKYMHDYSLGDFFVSKMGIFHDYGNELRQELSKLYKADRILFLDSGRSAFNLILKHLDLPPGSEVAIPVNVCRVVPDVIIANGLKPLFIDIDDNLTISLDDLKRKMTKNTKVVVPVHAFGNVCDMPSIMGFARKNRLVVVEDCAQTLDASFNKQIVGTFADYSFFSLDVTKHISSFGGGILVTKDDSFYRKTKSFLERRQKVGFGVLFNLFAFRFFSSPFIYSIFTKHLIRNYKQLSYYKPGNMRLSRIGTALAYSQVRKLSLISKTRSENARNFMLNLSDDVRILSSAKSRVPSYLFLPVGVRNPSKVERVLYRHYVDLPKAPPLLTSIDSYRPYYSGCPNSLRVYSSLILLPTYRKINSRITGICRIITNINRS